MSPVWIVPFGLCLCLLSTSEAKKCGDAACADLCLANRLHDGRCLFGVCSCDANGSRDELESIDRQLRKRSLSKAAKKVSYRRVRKYKSQCSKHCVKSGLGYRSGDFKMGTCFCRV